MSIAQIAQAADASPALVFHYFGSKATLYAAVVDAAIQTLADAQRAAQAQLDQGVSAMDRVAHPYWSTSTTSPPTPPPGPRHCSAERNPGKLSTRATTPEPVTSPRFATCSNRPPGPGATTPYGATLASSTKPACAGSKPAALDPDRHALIDAALGALEGALGEWAPDPCPAQRDRGHRPHTAPP